jgi:cobalt-zinc-cadmium efflux system membrane fusion protein
MMKNKLSLPLSLLFIPCVLSLSLWACGSGPDSRGIGDEVPAAQTDPEPESARPEGMVRLTERQMREFEVETGPAAPGRLQIEAVLPGEVVLNADRIAEVAPRVSGIVREVRKNLGDTVRRGDIMAVLESRELADLKADLLAARERVALAQSSLTREEQAWRKKISPEQDYLEAKNRLAEASIALRTAEQKLRALGFSSEYITQLPGRNDDDATLVDIMAPFAGTVMEKHINLGMVLKDDSAAFVIADLSTVWVNLDVQQKDLPSIKVGQTGRIGIGSETAGLSGRVSFIEPVATETNRTVHARIVVANADGRLRPGLFVTGRITLDTVQVPVLVSNEALVMMDSAQCVFVKESSGFQPRPVQTGRTDGAHTEITGGLSPGQLYVVKGAFTLKSELQKPEAEE